MIDTFIDRIVAWYILSGLALKTAFRVLLIVLAGWTIILVLQFAVAMLNVLAVNVVWLLTYLPWVGILLITFAAGMAIMYLLGKLPSLLPRKKARYEQRRLF